ncbi:MAG: hypothetical protein ACTSQX_07980, partial [Candidatus Heimdallarchaeota archaeon]
MTGEFMDTPIDYGEDEVNHFIPKGANARNLEISGDFPEITNIDEKLIEVVENPIDSPALSELIKKHYS